MCSSGRQLRTRSRASAVPPQMRSLTSKLARTSRTGSEFPASDAFSVAKDNKFGTFGGVFTPSLLTILGVIMYLRLPWVVGHGGLVQTLGIILVAHVISVATGLSISSIATDKNVGAGGPYYIVSRSLGLPIGGTLGLALFIGLASSVSLYVIGFSESFLSFFEIPITKGAIRVCGTVTLVLLTAITIISTALAIKTQYLILTLIALSLGSIFMGDPEAAPQATATSGEAPSFAVLFGIFFPAVTGFTAGVNMSGDLRNPKQSLPRGTMLAIFVGMAVYLGLAGFLWARVPADQLTSDPEVLLHISWIPGFVVAGIWGATLSSGLGSILGAPRILQATSKDGITPRVFARGHGKGQEPRNALVLAFLLAEGGILIAELDVIARVVSMVFLTMYAFLNVCCAIESSVSPDFRPAFRIPRIVSVIGALTSVVIMIQLDLAAMVGATALMAALFVWLQRRQLKLEAGDAWEGVWSSIIRSGLYRLTKEDQQQQQRNWRPNILSFRPAGGATLTLARFGESLITGNGILTDFEVLPRRAKKKQEDEEETGEGEVDVGERPVGVFRKELATDEPFRVIGDLCRHYGFAGIEPNALLLSWGLHRQAADEFTRLTFEVAELDFNLLVHHARLDADDEGKRIDVWWRAAAGNTPFSLALLRFLTRSPQWENSQVRFFLVSSDASNNDNLRTAMRRVLRESRVEASIKVINDTFGDRSFEDRVLNQSSDASLVLFGLPNDETEIDPEYLSRTDALVRNLRQTLLFRSSSLFEEVLPTGREAAVSRLPPPAEGGEAQHLPELKVSDVPDLARAAGRMAAAYQKLTHQLHEHCMQKLYGRHIELVRGIRAAAERHLDPSDKALSSGNERRQRNAFNRQQSSFLLECRTHFEKFEKTELPDLRAVLDGGVDAFLHHDGILPDEGEDLLVQRPKEDLKPHPDDTRYVRRFKRRRRIAAWFKRDLPSYRIPTRVLQRYYFRRAVEQLLVPSVREFASESHQLVVQLGKVINSTRASLPEDQSALVGVLERQREQLTGSLEGLSTKGKEIVSRHQWRLIVQALELTQAYADDIERFDVHLLARKERQVDDTQHADELSEEAAGWLSRQGSLVGRAKLALSLVSFQHRLITIARREREAIALGVRNGALSECDSVVAGLKKLAASLGEEGAERPVLRADFKNQFDPKPIVESLMRDSNECADELPESIETLSDESIQALEEGRTDQVEIVEIPVKRLVQFLVEAELAGGVQEALGRVPKLERRAMGVAQDVLRLVTFQLSELEAVDDEETELREQLTPIIDKGIERLRGEMQKLSEILPQLETTFDEKLHRVVDGSNAYDLTMATERLDQHIRLHQGKRAVSGARGAVRRFQKRVRRAMVGLLYRRSEGVLLARKRIREAELRDQVVDRVATMVRTQTPRAEVLEELPFFYRQLFFGQSAINDTFWVPRRGQMAKAKDALRQFDRGTSGAIFVTGERLSGKSALLQRMTTELFDKRPVYRVHAPAGGSVDPVAFTRALEKALDARGSGAELLGALAPRAVVMIDDLSLWWERGEGGLAVLNRIVQLIERYGDRVLFVVAIETQAFKFMDRLLPLSDNALTVLDCAPLPAEALKSVVTLRHGSTGMKFRFGSKEEDYLGEWALARLFTHHFDHSGGNVGVTLRAWISGIRRAKGDVIELEVPDRRDWEVIDGLRASWVALLLQLMLHKQLTYGRLRRVTGLDPLDLRRDVDALIRMGLVVESRQRVIEIDPNVHHIVSERFERRGLLA